MSVSDTATAHAAWDEQWKSAEGRAAWIRPALDVRWRARAERRRGARRVLDLGCGVGRHALYFASLGFETCAADGAAAGITHLNEQAMAAGLKIDARTGLMTDIPFDDGFFDYVLAYNVIYHGDGNLVRATIAEIARVLTPGGTYQGTMLGKRNRNFGVGREIAPDTFVDENAGGDKRHPHFYCDTAEIAALFGAFEIESLYLRDEPEKPGSWHWHLTARRR